MFHNSSMSCINKIAFERNNCKKEKLENRLFNSNTRSKL